MAKFKVGDKVRVKSKKWYDENKSKSGTVYTDGEPFVDDMAVYCGAIASIVSLDNENDYYIDIDNGAWIWNEDVFEDEPIKDESKPSFFTNLAEAINKVVSENKQGITIEEKDGSIIITPIEEEKKNLHFGAPCMASDDKKTWDIRFYNKDGMLLPFTFIPGKIIERTNKITYKYIIPLEAFNASNIEESLKHNIVK